MSEYDLVVIGSGPAGQKAAIAASKLGKQVAVVERNFSIGGSALHKGTIPSKTLREAVAFLSGVRLRELYGSSFRVKDRITIQDLTFRTNQVIDREVNIVRDQLIRNYVDVVPGTASFVDPTRIVVTSEDGMRTLTADKSVVAVGSTPARPPGIDFDDQRVVDSDGLLRLAEIPRSMTIVGAGIIGCEYATIFRTLGTRVTLIDGRQRPLDFIDDEIEDALYYHMRDEGVLLRFNETVSRVERNGERVIVSMESGKQLTTDALMFAAGRVGASSDLNLEAVGIETDPKGRIKVDEYYRTSIENIYAVGDIIGFPALASTSMEQGRLAALHALGVAVPRMAPSLPFGIYAIPEIAMIGPAEQDLTQQAVPYESGVARFRELSRVQISGGRHGLLKLLFHRETRKVLAVHIIGQSATELVHIGQAVIDHGGTIEYFRDAVFNYPTLAEAYKVAALDGLNKLV
jgi:NAD(P) transhydrogenase